MIRRLLMAIPTLFLLTLLIFILIHLVPGDIIDAMAGLPAEIAVDRPMLERQLGLDAPLLVQYGRWMGVWPQMDGGFNGVFQGNLGMSYWRRVPTLELVSSAWPITLELGFMGVIIAQLIGLSTGIYSALRQDKWGDYLGRTFAIGCISIPNFWVATLVVIFPAVWWGYMPPIMVIPFTEDPIGNLKMFIVPAIILGMAMSGSTMRLARTQVLEVMRQDYIRTAWAKGLTERVVIIRHALKNALIPVVTMIGPQLSVLLGGAVVVEKVFSLPGVGRLSLDATLNRDYPIVVGVMFIMAVIIMVFNLAVDLTYGYLDPRIHYR